MILAGETRAARVSVRRSRVAPCTQTNAFGRPRRVENPAARMTTCSLGREVAFIAIMVA